MTVDLHVHSTASDGTLTPEELVRHAASLGLEAVALCDHDTVEGVPAALEHGERFGVEVVTGVELSCDTGGLDLHVLGYYVDIRQPSLLQSLGRFRAARLARARKMVEALVRAGYRLDISDVLHFADGGAVGRSHVARALVHGGHVESVRQAFAQLIGRGRPYFVPKMPVEPEEGVSLVLQAGGVPVLAHPGVSKADRLIPRLVEAGLAGLEAYHAEHDHAQRRHYEAMAGRMGLLVTGGSDFHGPGSIGAPMGEPELPYSMLEALKQAVRAR